MAILLCNACLVDLDPPGVEENGRLRIEEGRIAARGEAAREAPGDELLDCEGALVLPGLVNGHTHLYSALALGMPPPPRAPANFEQILEWVWWRLDRALDESTIRLSAQAGALDALRCGVTTLIDHHASPSCIEGSLDLLEEGAAEVGLRAVFCYETTDRNGRDGRDAGLRENRRYLQKIRQRAEAGGEPRGGRRFAGLAGAHAAFTCADGALEATAALAAEFGAGAHLHAAEDPCDDRLCRERYGAPLAERLERAGLFAPETLFVHGTHLNAAALARLRECGATLAHNPRSNMNNAVGYAPAAALREQILLGTDGIGSDLWTEARFAFFRARDAGAALGADDVLAALARSARRASRALGVELGRLAPGAAADLIVTDYHPPTPLCAGNLAGFLLFGLGAQWVRHVMIAGRWALRDRAARRCDERAILARARESAPALWRRMETLAPATPLP